MFGAASSLRAVCDTWAMAETWPYEVKWDAVDAHFKAPPELLQPLPRRVLPRDGEDMGCRARLGRGCLGGCLLPLFVLGLLMALWGGLAALILPLGKQTTGVVFERERGNGSDTTYNLKFRFRANERGYEGHWLVPVEKWKRTQIGDSVRVRYFPFAPGMQPLIEDGASPWTLILVIAPFGCLMMGIFGLPLWGAMSGRSGKRLVKRGLVAPAFVTRRDDARNTVAFLVRDENGRVHEVEARAKDVAYHYAGQTEVALFLRGKAQNARLYRWLDWNAVLPDIKKT